ncbi:MAG: hypothetical protein HC817_12665 [Saprospiraceae bacterium]|nr:hypothetical protein [Saprospiraceae bacterium]
MASTTVRQPLTGLQLELLDTFSRQSNAEDLINIKNLIAHYFAQKAMDEADKLWDERGYSQETMTNWLNDHKRTPYKR